MATVLEPIRPVPPITTIFMLTLLVDDWRSPTRAQYPSVHSFGPSGARWARFERFAEVLCLAHDLARVELHDAHDVRGSPVIGDDDFADPEPAGADDAPHGEPLPARLRRPRRLYIAPTTDT